MAQEGHSPAHRLPALDSACPAPLPPAPPPRSVFDELFCGLLPPDEVAFAVMLRGWGCSGKAPAWNEMSALLTTMEREYNITPSTITFNALLEACTRSNDAERAEEVMQRMLAAGIVPDDWTLEAVRGKRAFRSLLKRNFGVTFD